MPPLLRHVTASCLLLLLATAAARAQDSTTALDPMGQPLPVPSVKLLAPEVAASGNVRRFFGRIAARETVDLSFEVGGRLVMLPVVEGDTTPQGTVVAGLETGSFERVVTRARLALALAQADRERSRARQLAASNAASAVRAEDAETSHELAAVALADAEEALRDATLATPFTALVVARLAATLSNVSPDKTILRLHDMSQIRVQIDVPERLFQSGIPPEAITFTGEVSQLADPIPLDLIECEAQTEAIGQTCLVTLELPPLDIPTLIPGASMTVTATVDADFGLPGRALPAAALRLGPERRGTVMVFEPDATDPDQGTLRETGVEVISIAGTELRVLGLDPGATIVGAGVHVLRDGQKVRRDTGLTVEE